MLTLVLGWLILIRPIPTDVTWPGTNPSTTRTSGNGAKTSILLGPIAFQTVVWTQYGGGYQGITEINDAENWSSLWGTLTPPSINFSSQTVLIAAAGEEGSAGYLINVTSVTGFADHVLVAATITTPGQNCVTAAVITDPIHIVAVHKVDVPATLEVTVSQGPACPL